MPIKYVRTIFLSLAIIAIFAWTQSPVLNQYNLQLSGALILLYFASKYLFRRVERAYFFATIVLISVVLLLIFSTGGISSPIFFILFFLLFAIALLLAPHQALIASFLLVSIFLWQNFQNLNSAMIIDLLTLVLITPLAIVFSNSYLKYLASEGKISLLKEAIKDEEINSLLWISTTAKPSLAGVVNSLTDIVMYLNSKTQATVIPQQLLEKLKLIQKNLISLYASTGNLETSIKESSDKMEL
jgi:hypothetical protein